MSSSELHHRLLDNWIRYILISLTQQLAPGLATITVSSAGELTDLLYPAVVVQGSL